MSGASWPCCYVCGRTGLVSESDRIEGTLMEKTERCPHCGLYEYEYLTGSSRERFGFVTLDRHQRDAEDDAAWPRQQEERRAAMADARAFAADPEVTPFLARWREDPTDVAPLLVLADRLDELGRFSAQAAGIRASAGSPDAGPAR